MGVQLKSSSLSPTVDHILDSRSHNSCLTLDAVQKFASRVKYLNLLLLSLMPERLCRGHLRRPLEADQLHTGNDGTAFYPSPINFKNATDGRPISFSTTFVFAIVPVYPNMSGHGIAFALAPSKELPGSMPSQYLGLFSKSDNGQASNHVVAVELDTVKSVDFADINANHVGIDVNDLKSVNASPVAYFDSREGVLKSLQLISGEPMQVWVDYDGGEMKLGVMVAPLNKPKP
ncbi:hypothetical protein BHM03_00042738 [Ensete ventricosum]|uniref:Legume lectin domain-containing protein n=1 Tax=Ensete ventricosum TaxID=4639 RepID=A0A445MKM8_ENSVE|nr:hypothetical protein BHM03_00042738 [Ensete ventricosum]